ncbi:MAG: arylsulfatase [Lachnospiraceae bacterium]|nr:arylsulfatase [Lachnospiraceae bacterium]
MRRTEFTGTVGRTMAETRYQYHTVDTDPKDAPNVIYILLDDMGFAQLGCYGSSIATPNIDRLAKEGLRYNNFHTTAVCSATRASLLTGANHHMAGIASLCELRTGCDNGIGHLKPEYATIAEILKEYGYATFCTGKWHLAANQGAPGPVDGWPLQKGFDRYYGFLQGENDQYHPHLVQDNTAVAQPKSVEEGYHFSEDIVDHAIDYLFEHQMNFPEQPFFLYLAFGAMHTPHHAPKEYIDRYRGKFDAGWDEVRQQWFENQKRIGIIPPEAELTEKNEYVRDWAALNEKEKAVYAREMEAFAGMLTHTDDQIGRLIAYLEESDQLDHTMIVFLSDNGASAEGGIDGRFNAMRGQDVTVRSEGEIEYAYEHLDEIGTELAFNHYPTGWANCGNTPFQWYKIWAHEGGIKDPLIIRYPKGIEQLGGVRSQYHHVSDLTPTVLEVIGVDKPEYVKGVKQKPFTGVSMQYSFNAPEAGSQKHIQYYEVHGNRGIYKDGWKAVVNHTFVEDYEKDEWELYHVEVDYSEKYNVAEKYPEKLRELQADFEYEAGKYGVYPMLRFAMHGKPENLSRMYGDRMTLPEKRVTFHKVLHAFDLVYDRNIQSQAVNHTVVARIVRETAEDEGVLYSNGQRFGGISFYVKDNRLKYVYNANKAAYYEAVSETELPVGEVTVGYRFVRDQDHATVTLFVNGKEVGQTVVEQFCYMIGFTSTVGDNRYTPVTPDYEVPFAFSGRIEELTLYQAPTTVSSREELLKLLSVE